MGVGVVDPLAPEPAQPAPVIEHIVGVPDGVPPLAQHGAAAGVADDPGSLLHAPPVPDTETGEDLRLRDVGGDEGGQGEQLLPQRLQRLLFQQAGAAGGHHHRVHHQVLNLVVGQTVRNDPDEGGGGHHPRFDGVRDDVGKNTVQLEGEKLRGAFQHPPDAGGVLCGKGGDGAHGVHPVHGHGLEVGLDAGAAAGVAAGNGQSCFHGWLLSAPGARSWKD